MNENIKKHEAKKKYKQLENLNHISFDMIADLRKTGGISEKKYFTLLGLLHDFEHELKLAKRGY